MKKFSETTTGQYFLKKKARAKDRGKKVVLLMYDIIHDHPRKTLIWVVVIGSIFYVLFGHLDELGSVFNKASNLIPGMEEK